MKKKWLAVFIIYITLLAACLIVIYAVPSVKGMLEKTYVTEYGKIDITDEVSAYIVRDETVYVAAQDSEVERLADTDRLIKAKTKIVKLTPIIDEEAEAAKEAGPDADQEAAQAAAEANGEAPENISRKYVRILEDLGGDVHPSEKGVSQQAGYISYNIDGAESRLSTDKIDEISQKDFEEFTTRKKVETQSQTAGKGDPIFKVIHNSKWYLVFYIDNKAGEKYVQGRTVSIDINGSKVPVKVAEVQAGKETTRVVLSCKSFFEGFFEERTMKTTVTVASAEGLVLQDSSIVKKGEQIGVFVKNKLGEHRFKPISIKVDDGERCVVYSDIYVDAEGNYVETLSTYDEIVAEPTEEEIADLQVQAAKEAEEKAQREKEAADRAAREAGRDAAIQEALKKAAAKQAAAEAEDNGQVLPNAVTPAAGETQPAEGTAPAADAAAQPAENAADNSNNAGNTEASNTEGSGE